MPNLSYVKTTPPGQDLKRSRGVPRSAFRQASAGILALAIFCLDSFTTLSSAVSTLYVVVLLVASDRSDRRHLLGWSILCATLTIASYAFVHGWHAHLDVTLRVLVSLAANIVTTGLLLHRQIMDDRIAEEERRSRRMLNSLALAIWEHDFRPIEDALAGLRASGLTDLRAYLRKNPQFVKDLRRAVRITDVNQTAIDLMGIGSKSEFFERLDDLLPETDESFPECIVALDERRDMFQSEARVIDANGQPIDVIVAFSLSPGVPLDRVPASILDIRQRKQLETTIERGRIELDRVQRSAALGAVSASIAHEINQPMSAIQSYANAASRWLSRDVPDLAEVRQSLKGLNSAVSNVYDVMQRVRNLVGSSQGETGPLDLRDLIADTITFASRDTHAHDARIAFSSRISDTIVHADRILIRHLMLNLITNALQAMEEADSPEKRIEVMLDNEGNEARISLRDTGPGLPPGARENPFETFYTTKSGGMGLGLSICRSIVDLHGGRITLGNHPDGGVIVSFSLPVQTLAVSQAVNS